MDWKTKAVLWTGLWLAGLTCAVMAQDALVTQFECKGFANGTPFAVKASLSRGNHAFRELKIRVAQNGYRLVTPELTALKGASFNGTEIRFSEDRGATVLQIDFPPNRITVNGHTGYAELGEMQQGRFRVLQRFHLAPLE